MGSDIWPKLPLCHFCPQVDIHPDKYFENTLNILRKLARVEQDRLGTPVNKTLWNAAPAVVNAYYSRNKNQISRCYVLVNPG